MERERSLKLAIELFRDSPDIQQPIVEELRRDRENALMRMGDAVETAELHALRGEIRALTAWLEALE